MPKYDAWTDGGVAARNPSPVGVSWAYVVVDRDSGLEAARDSGVVLPAEFGLPALSNNLAEFYAVLRVLEAVRRPEKFGVVFTDSLCAKCWWKRSPGRHKPKALPETLWVRRRAALAKFDQPPVFALIPGHSDRGNRDAPAYPWNVLADRLASEARDRLAAEHKEGRAA